MKKRLELATILFGGIKVLILDEPTTGLDPAAISAAGSGIIIGTFIKNINGAIITGVGIAVVSMSITGVTFPYSFLPEILQVFSRYYPFSSSNAIISYMLSVPEFVGYNPMSAFQLSFTIAISIIIFITSLILYSKFCWRSD